MKEDNVEIDVFLARRLIASQFPQWKELSIDSVETSGWDNRTFRLGKEMSVRLPSAAKENGVCDNSTGIYCSRPVGCILASRFVSLGLCSSETDDRRGRGSHLKVEW